MLEGCPVLDQVPAQQRMHILAGMSTLAAPADLLPALPVLHLPLRLLRLTTLSSAGLQ